MFPLRDNIPSRRTAWITRLLVAVNMAAFLLELKLGPSLETALYRFGVVPSNWLVTQTTDFLDWPGLFLALLTSQFLHGGFLHIFSNMYYLWIFADNVEDRLGHFRFLMLYLGCGVVAAVVQILSSPHSSVPMIGASGAIAGVLGAYLLMFPGARIVTLVPLFLFWQTIELPAFFFLGIWFLIQWAQGVATIGQVADMGGVAFWAHVGGFVAGMLGVLIIRPRRRW